MNPGKKQYIFYSNMHQSWSKIDMIWMIPELNGNVQEIEIETKLWAGHNPVKISWKAHKRKIMDFKPIYKKRERIYMDDGKRNTVFSGLKGAHKKLRFSQK
uniref:Uncharacterized protein n=1 Tax=Micrurus surinamensis TaxID=129470 RepID=A0A2D4NW29_MICSU